MFRRELNVREKKMLLMIRPTTFRDIVNTVRRDIEHGRYNAKKQLREMKNGNG